jgi:hypothetical protein
VTVVSRIAALTDKERDRVLRDEETISHPAIRVNPLNVPRAAPKEVCSWLRARQR